MKNSEIKIVGFPEKVKKEEINKEKVFEEELSKYLKELLKEKPKSK